MTEIIHADIALARRIEAAHTASSFEFVHAHHKLFDDSCAALLAVAGGYAIYFGINSPLTQAMGLGLNGPVDDAELDQLEEFYRSRDSAVNIELCPLVEAALLLNFAKRNYHLIECSNVFVRTLTDKSEFDDQPAGIEISLVTKDDLASWADTLARGFGADNPEFYSLLTELGQTGFYVKDAVCVAARIDGQLVGGGSMGYHEGVAVLHGASTLPEYRGRGVQTALLRARLRMAIEHGCDLASIITMPGTISQRNSEKQNFRVIYTRTKLLREWQ